MTNNDRRFYHAIIRLEGETDQGATWLKIGAAWSDKHQRGLNLVLNELPFVPDGSQTIYLRSPKTVKSTDSR